MEGFDNEQFSALIGNTGKRQQRKLEKKQLEKKAQNAEYEEKFQKHALN